MQMPSELRCLLPWPRPLFLLLLLLLYAGAGVAGPRRRLPLRRAAVLRGRSRLLARVRGLRRPRRPSLSPPSLPARRPRRAVAGAVGPPVAQHPRGSAPPAAARPQPPRPVLLPRRRRRRGRRDADDRDGRRQERQQRGVAPPSHRRPRPVSNGRARGADARATRSVLPATLVVDCATGTASHP